MLPTLTPIEIELVRAQTFGSSLLTIKGLLDSLEEMDHAEEMVKSTIAIKDLRPSVKDFLTDLKEIRKFHIKCSNIFEDNLGISA